ncbi:septum formation family protein [Mycolicibacterium hodleri]
MTGDDTGPGTNTVNATESRRADAVFGDVGGGACLSWPNGDTRQPSVVDCADEHMFEVANSFKINGGQAPCQLAVQRYLGNRYDPTGKYTIAALWPGNAATSLNDSEQLLCGLELLGPDGQPVPFKGQVAQYDQSKVWSTGTCLGIDSTTNQPTESPVDCAAPHAIEITGTVNVGEEFSSPPPTPTAQDDFLEKACTKMADAYLPGVTLNATGLTVRYGTISPASWLAGSRQLSCGLGATMGGDRGWATLTGTVTRGHLINGQPPAAPEPQQTNQYQEDPETAAPSILVSVPEVVEETSSTPTPTSDPTTTNSTAPEPETPTSQAPPPGGLVIGVPGFSPVTLTPLPPPPPPGAPSPLPAPPPSLASPIPPESQPQGPRPGP